MPWIQDDGGGLLSSVATDHPNVEILSWPKIIKARQTCTWFFEETVRADQRYRDSARRIVGPVSQRQVHMNELSYVTVSGSGYIRKSKSIK